MIKHVCNLCGAPAATVNDVLIENGKEPQASIYLHLRLEYRGTPNPRHFGDAPGFCECCLQAQLEKMIDTIKQEDEA
jgi:hypothetical protein